MTWDVAVDLIGKLAWPVVALVVLLCFRVQIAQFIDRIREFEGPGDVKARLDPGEVERIVEEGKAKNSPAAEVAKRIVEEAIVDPKELRILRALLGEVDGRHIYAYQSGYRSQITDLLRRGYIRKRRRQILFTRFRHEGCDSALKASPRKSDQAGTTLTQI